MVSPTKSTVLRQGPIGPSECHARKQVSIGNDTFNLDKTFLVMATQNPVDQEGTYTLPEAQLDRFMFKVNVDYPSVEDEIKVLKSVTSGTYRL